MEKLRGFKSRFTAASSLAPPLTDVDNDTSLIQLIDGDGKFNVKGLDSFSTMVRLSDCGLSYAVVSIIGPQSSGKSTLVNNLFGTKGIWFSKAADIEPCTVVIDVEGSDGMERGEGGVLFEKQSALFALAVSDVVLVNMWCHEVGRENGGGRPLLKIVFEKILSLTTPRKMTLLFVLRDQSVTPLEHLEKILMKSIQEIYDSVPKPEAYASTPLNMFFNVEVVSLPSYQDKAEEFKQQIEDLRTIFVDSTTSTGLIGVQEDKVPASEISFSLLNIWKTIKENKDLDLPAHKVMVATVRCDEIIKEALSIFSANEEWRRTQRSLKSGLVLEFGKTLNLIITTTLSEFDVKAAYFDEGVRVFKRESLLDKVLQLVYSANESMLDHLCAKAVMAFKKNFDNADRTSEHFVFSVQDCTAYAMSAFEEGTKDMENGYISWDSSKYRDRVQRDIDVCVKFYQLEASVAESEAARQEAFALMAAAKADAAKALADARSAAEILATAQEAATAAAANTRAAAEAQAFAAKAAAEKASADVRAAAAARASLAAQEAAKVAEAEAVRKKESLKEYFLESIKEGFSQVLSFFGWKS